MFFTKTQLCKENLTKERLVQSSPHILHCFSVYSYPEAWGFVEDHYCDVEHVFVCVLITCLC